MINIFFVSNEYEFNDCMFHGELHTNFKHGILPQTKLIIAEVIDVIKTWKGSKYHCRDYF